MTKKYDKSLGRSIEGDIRNAPDYYDGEYESVKARLDKTAEILGRVIDCLGSKTRKRIAKEFNYEESDDA